MHRLLDAWAAQGVKATPLTEREARQLEVALRVEFTPAFREYLRTVGGMKDAEWDAELLHFWNAADLRERAREWVARTASGVTLVPFADWSIDCHLFLVAAAPTGPVWVAWGAGPADRKQVTATFGEYIDAYLADPLRAAHLGLGAPPGP